MGRFKQFSFELSVFSPTGNPDLHSGRFYNVTLYSGKFSPVIGAHLADIARDTKGDAIYGINQKAILDDLFEINLNLPQSEKIPPTVGNFFKFMELIDPENLSKTLNDPNLPGGRFTEH